MKVMICGKGGSGKSTLTTLLAKALAARGRTVLVLDTDESNLCLHRLLGLPLPAALMAAMGGRAGAKEHLHPTLPKPPAGELLKESMSLADLPADCVAEAGGVKLLVVGKIERYGEGCACMIGGIAKAILARLQEAADEFILIDAEAGLEHFGRRVDAGCDLVLNVVDPSFESLTMAGRCSQLARAAGIEAYLVLNKVDGELLPLMTERLDPARIVAQLPKDDDLFLRICQVAPGGIVFILMDKTGKAPSGAQNGSRGRGRRQGFCKSADQPTTLSPPEVFYSAGGEDRRRTVMKDTASIHQKVQSLCDCFVTTDYLQEMAEIARAPESQEAALKWIALAVLHGINNNAEKISLTSTKNGKVTVTAEYRTAELPSPGADVGKQIVESIREMTHMGDKDKEKVALAFGFRNDSFELKVKSRHEGGDDKITINFP